MKIELNKKISVLNKKTILLTGAKGMLGASFEDIIKKVSPDCKLISTSKKQMDITDKEEVLSYGDSQIDIIIHCASITSPLSNGNQILPPNLLRPPLIMPIAILRLQFGE